MHRLPYPVLVWTLLVLWAATSALFAGDREQLSHLYQSRPSSSQIPGFGDAWFTEYVDNNLKSDHYGLKLCIVDAPIDNLTLRVRNTRSTESIRSAFVRASEQTALAAINGGYFGYDNRKRYIPLGYVRSAGKTDSRVTKWTSGGMLIGTADEIRIVPIGGFEVSDADLDAVQSKPMLVEKGRDGIRTSTDERFDRSAVGLTKNGRVVLAVLTNPLGSAGTLAEFSHLLTKYKGRTGGRIEWALAMDGGPGAHLYVPSLRRHCGDGSVPFIPNILVWEARP